MRDVTRLDIGVIESGGSILSFLPGFNSPASPACGWAPPSPLGP
jgi:hypothetical protein